MLIIGRKRDQKIVISDDIEITILEIGRNRVRFGIQAPKDVPIHTKLQRLPAESAVEIVANSSTEVESKPSERQVQTLQAVAGHSVGAERDLLQKPSGPKSLKPF